MRPFVRYSNSTISIWCQERQTDFLKNSEFNLESIPLFHQYKQHIVNSIIIQVAEILFFWFFNLLVTILGDLIGTLAIYLCNRINAMNSTSTKCIEVFPCTHTKRPKMTYTTADCYMGKTEALIWKYVKCFNKTKTCQNGAKKLNDKNLG